MLLCERLSVGASGRGDGFFKCHSLQCKQERLGVGGLVRGWNRASERLGMETCYESPSERNNISWLSSQYCLLDTICV